MLEVGDIIKINYMKDKPNMTGVEGTVKYIDDFQQIHCKEFNFVVVPDMDDYEIIKKKERN